MVVICKGKCTLYRAPRNTMQGSYKTELRYCRICETYLQWLGLFCPCCNAKIRTIPRDNDTRLKFFKEVKRID